MTRWVAPRRMLAVAALAASIPGAAPAPADAQESPAAGAQELSDSAIEARTRAIAARLRCVVCQGLSIEDSPAELAREMRAIVREQVAAGRTREEIEAYFIDRYGEFVLLEPRARGFNLVVYLLPVAALAAGALFVLAFVRRWSAPEPEPDEESDRFAHAGDGSPGGGPERAGPPARSGHGGDGAG